jgi:hypothetical protein
MLLFTNAQLFFGTRDDTEVINRNNENMQTDNSISSVIEDNEQKKQEVDSIIQKYDDNFDISQKTTSLSVEQDLRLNMKTYDFDFNLLPPTDRLVVSKINLDVPLVDSKYKNEVDFTQGNFNEELEN